MVKIALTPLPRPLPFRPASALGLDPVPMRRQRCERCGGWEATLPPAAAAFDLLPMRRTRVFLSTCHLDYDPTNNAAGNLTSLCQRCHLLHDTLEHRQRRAVRVLARQACGDLFSEPYGWGWSGDSITFARFFALARLRGGYDAVMGGPMCVSKILRSSMKGAGLLVMLPLSACAAISDGNITYKGVACNVVCQRWMGVESRSQDPSRLLLTQSPVVVKRLATRQRTSAETQPSRHRQSTSIEASPPPDRPLIVPTMVSSDPARRPATIALTPSRWGTQLPGSAETLSGDWLSQ